MRVLFALCAATVLLTGCGPKEAEQAPPPADTTTMPPATTEPSPTPPPSETAPGSETTPPADAPPSEPTPSPTP
jgi:type VI secretion system secreted protein VgrG